MSTYRHAHHAERRREEAGLDALWEKKLEQAAELKKTAETQAKIQNTSITPRKYKIEHEVNEYFYYVTWVNLSGPKRWVIELDSSGDFLTESNNWDYLGYTTKTWNSPEEAFKGWKKYIELKF